MRARNCILGFLLLHRDLFFEKQMFFVNVHLNPDLYLIFLECNWMSRLASAHELYCPSCISLFPWEQYIWSFRERTTISLFAWEDFFVAKIGIIFFLGGICFLQTLHFVFVFCYLFLLMIKRPFITSNTCKEAINNQSKLRNYFKNVASWLYRELGFSSN